LNDKPESFKKLFDLTDRTAIVTGGAGGLGRFTSLGLADYGANVVVTSRNLENLQKVADEVKSRGRDALAIQADLTKEEDVQRMVKQVVDRFGRIDILVTYAGMNIPKPAEEYPLTDWKSVLDINVTGVFLCNREVGKVMIQQKKGKIINVSSVRGGYGLTRNYIAYCTSKGAVNMITRQLACEWAKFNVLVNAIAPTVIETPLTSHILANPEFARTMKDRIPMGRWGYPQDLIGCIVFLASDASSFITGQIIYIDGGIGSEAEDVVYLKNTADRLIGAENYTWSVIGVGYPWQFYVGSLSTMMGGHVRVGLEDNIYLERGVLAKSSGELVAKMARIAGELGRETATPDEARKILGLKGIDRVNF